MKRTTNQRQTEDEETISGFELDHFPHGSHSYEAFSNPEVKPEADLQEVHRNEKGEAGTKEEAEEAIAKYFSDSAGSSGGKGRLGVSLSRATSASEFSSSSSSLEILNDHLKTSFIRHQAAARLWAFWPRGGTLKRERHRAGHGKRFERKMAFTREVGKWPTYRCPKIIGSCAQLNLSQSTPGQDARMGRENSLDLS